MPEVNPRFVTFQTENGDEYRVNAFTVKYYRESDDGNHWEVELDDDHGVKYFPKNAVNNAAINAID